MGERAAWHLERSLSALLEGRTAVEVAHRLHTAHDELVAAGGDYATLWRSWQQD